MIISIYKLHLIRNIFKPFLITLCVVTSIIWITQVIRFLYLVELGIGIIDFLKIVIYIIPALIYLILPYVTLFAVTFSYSNLTFEKQIIILKSSGLSNKDIALPIILFCILVTIFGYIISFYAMPLSYSKLERKIYISKNAVSANIINEKQFTKISKETVLYCLHKTSKNRLKGLVIFDSHKTHKESIIFAKSGEFKLEKNNLVLELEEGFRQFYDSNNNLSKFYFKDLKLLLQNDLDMGFTTSRKKNLKERYLKELLFPYEERPYLSRHRQGEKPFPAESATLMLKKYNNYITEGNNRIIWPFYSVAFSIIAISILLNALNTKKINYKPYILIVLYVTLNTYLHFTLYNLSLKNLNFIYGSYSLAFFTFFLSLSIISKL